MTNGEKITSLFDKWITPTTLITIFGGIVWGIQLNFVVLEHTKQIAAIEKESYSIEAMTHTNAQSIIRITTMLDSIERRVNQNTQHAESHEQSAEKWKRNIIQNQSRIKALESK